MKAIRYSKQRELIYKALASTKSHPSAEMIYQELKPKHPSLSLGTVYRNLNQLAQMGRAVRMPFDTDRYDADCCPHAHFLCTCCNNLYDLDFPLDYKSEKAVEAMGHEVHRQELLFRGICKICVDAGRDESYTSDDSPASAGFAPKNK